MVIIYYSPKNILQYITVPKKIKLHNQKVNKFVLHKK